MLLLPTFDAALRPCLVNPAEFAPHPQGHFCGQCQRVVHDFSQSANPGADLAAARAAAPDGRVCGRFGAAQVQAAPALSRRRRWFVVALVLVVTQGLTAREALAQVRSCGSGGPVPTNGPATGQTVALPPTTPPADPNGSARFVLGVVVDTMPSLHGGGRREVMRYMQQQIAWPRRKGKMVLAQGRALVSFTVGPGGRVGDAKIVKSLHPRFDAEVRRVVRTLPRFSPGRENGAPAAVSFTMPVSFRLR